MAALCSISISRHVSPEHRQPRIALPSGAQDFLRDYTTLLLTVTPRRGVGVGLSNGFPEQAAVLSAPRNVVSRPRPFPFPFFDTD